MEQNPISWFEIYVQDMKRARMFYEAVFQVNLEKIESAGVEIYTFPVFAGKRGSSGSLVKAPNVMSGGNSTLVYFQCEDCADEASRVLQNGGIIKRDKMSIGRFGFVVLAFDTEGNLIGLHSSR